MKSIIDAKQYDYSFPKLRTLLLVFSISFAECSPVTVYQGFGDKNIGQRTFRDLYSKNFTLSIGISMYRYANNVQPTHSHNKTKSFIVLCCFHFSIFVHYTYFTLWIPPRSCSHSISFASCLHSDILSLQVGQLNT